VAELSRGGMAARGPPRAAQVLRRGAAQENDQDIIEAREKIIRTEENPTAPFFIELIFVTVAPHADLSPQRG
jgi:hypothetical protein